MSQQENLNKNQIKTVGKRTVFIVCAIMFVLAGTATFAKYYSMQKQKGVAVSSEFYFGSNILKNGVVFGNDGAPTTIAPYVKTNGWSAGSSGSTVQIQIRNCENSLLYNDANIEIHYDVYVMLKEKATNGIKYYIQQGQSSTDITNYTTPTKVYSDQILPGGEVIEQDYVLRFINSESSAEPPKDVYVWIVPTQPSYINATQYTMGACISLVAASEAFTFESGFDIDLEASDKALTAAQKALIRTQAGLIFNIATTGVYEQSENKGIVPVRLTWNPLYVELDRFSEFNKNVLTDGNGMKYVDMDLQTYTSENLIFYRTTAFTFDKIQTANDFLNLVQAELRE